jgi:hypothetical protein
MMTRSSVGMVMFFIQMLTLDSFCRFGNRKYDGDVVSSSDQLKGYKITLSELRYKFTFTGSRPA